MDGRIDDSPIALTTYESTLFTHKRGYIDLTYSRGVIFSAVSLGDIAQSPGRREIGYSNEVLATLSLSAFQEIIGNADECIFLHERLPVLADEGEPVNIRINRDTEVGACLHHLGRKFSEVLRKRFRIMCKVAVRIAVHTHALHSHSLKKSRHNNSSDGVDCIKHDLEARFLDSLNIHVLEFQHLVQMPVGKVLLGNGTDRINVCKIEIP